MLIVDRKEIVFLIVIVCFRVGSEVGCVDGRYLEMYIVWVLGRGIFGKFVLGFGDDGKE